MKIITLERRTMDGEPIEQDALKNNTEDYRDWWCVIETAEEYWVYEQFLKHGESSVYAPIWNGMMKHAGQPQGLSWGDDDVYGYLMLDEDVPEVGEEMVDSDGDTWVRLS